MGDAFEDRLVGSMNSLVGEQGERAKVPRERQFVGFDAYQKVIGLAPDWLDAYSRLGALLEAGRRYKEAIVLYRRAAALHPSNLQNCAA